jgi:hypothetical protein
MVWWGGFTGAYTSLNLEEGRSVRPKGAELNSLGKGLALAGPGIERLEDIDLVPALQTGLLKSGLQHL